MRRMTTIVASGLALALAAGLSGCGGSDGADKTASGTAAAAGGDAAAPASPGAAPASALAAAPAIFGQCASCHSVQPGKHGIGPSLVGVYGTKAGEIAGYNFSAPLKASGLTWDDATLDQWLAGPMKLVPGTKMTFGGVSDPAKRAELIAYLKSLK